MQKEIIVLGDVEIGAGNLTDDFIDPKLVEICTTVDCDLPDE